MYSAVKLDRVACRSAPGFMRVIHAYMIHDARVLKYCTYMRRIAVHGRPICFLQCRFDVCVPLKYAMKSHRPGT
jgi:hypothetical protein